MVRRCSQDDSSWKLTQQVAGSGGVVGLSVSAQTTKPLLWETLAEHSLTSDLPAAQGRKYGDIRYMDNGQEQTDTNGMVQSYIDQLPEA